MMFKKIRKNIFLFLMIGLFIFSINYRENNIIENNMIENIENEETDIENPLKSYVGTLDVGTIFFDHVKGTSKLKVSCSLKYIDIDNAYNGEFATSFIMRSLPNVYDVKTGELSLADLGLSQFSFHELHDESYGQTLEGYSDNYITNYGSSDLNVYTPDFTVDKELRYGNFQSTTESDSASFMVYWGLYPLISLDSDYYNFDNIRVKVYDKIIASWIEFNPTDIILSHPEYKMRIYDKETNNLIFEDLEYQFFKYYREIFIDSLKIQNNAPEVINTTILESNHYKGIYSFDFDEVHTQPLYNNLSYYGTTYIDKGDSEHSKILTLSDSDSIDSENINITFNNQISGIIEFYVKTTDVFTCLFYLDSDYKIYIYTDIEKLVYYDGAHHVICDFNYDEWHHLKIFFNCTSDTFDIWLDGILVLDDASFTSSSSNINNVIIGTGLTQSDYYIYIDAIDFSWSNNYYEGRNLELNTSQDLWSWGANPEWESGYYGWNENLDDWYDESPVGCDVLIVSEFDNHKNVIEMNDQSSSGQIDFNRTFNSQTSGSIEFFIQTTDSTKQSQIIYHGDPSGFINLIIGHTSGYLSYYGGAWYTIAPIISSTQYHFRLTFECGSGLYDGLLADTFNIYINGVKYGGYNFGAVADSIKNLRFTSAVSHTNYQLYIDGTGFSWDNSLQFPYAITLENTTFSKLSIETYSTLVNPYSNILTNYTQTNHLVNITDIYGNVLEYRNLTELENEIIYTPANVKNCLITLSDQFLNYLDYKNYYLKVDDNLIYEQYFYREIGDSVNISIYDRFEQYLISTIHVIDRDNNFININLTIFSLKILNQLHDATILNITNQISTDIVFSENIAVDELISLKFKEANYTLYYIDDSNIEHTLNFTITKSRLIILNTTYHDVYFSYFDISGLGLDSDIARLYINNERREIGKNLIKGDNCNIKVLDYFNATLYSSSISLIGLVEFNIYIPVYTMLINNNYTESMEMSISRKDIDIEFKQIIGGHDGFSIRLLANIEYTVKFYYTNGTLAETKIILLDENFKNLSFGFYESDFDVELLKSELNDWILVVIILGSFLGVSIGIIIYLRNNIKKRKNPVESKHNKTRLGLYR